MTQRSSPYDHSQYVTSDGLSLPSLTGNAAVSKYVSFTARQLKSVTLLPTTAGTSADVVQFIAVTTLPTSLALASGVTTAYAGTSTLTVLALATFGSAVVAPQNIALSGGTFNVQVININGTTTSTATATNVVFPTGPSGGIAIGANDQYQLKKGTDATVVYTAEIEYNFTPGSNYTL